MNLETLLAAASIVGTAINFAGLIIHCRRDKREFRMLRP